ncbi:hypothetical protein ACVINW_004051 [Bradyrhizobium sp. USDA 4461]
MTHVTIDYGSPVRHPSQCRTCARFSVDAARLVMSNISNLGALAVAGLVDGGHGFAR